jgi:methylphosphotriester-DNA--protein-cysteine methyltransferase
MLQGTFLDLVLSTNIFCLSARNREKKKKNEMQKTWLGTTKTELSLAHRTVSDAPG